MKLDTKLTTRPDIVAVQQDGETVMMDVESGKYYKLTGVGGTIWSLMETETTPKEIIEKLMQSYDVSRQECEEQTVALLEQMADRGIISVIQ